MGMGRALWAVFLLLAVLTLFTFMPRDGLWLSGSTRRPARDNYHRWKTDALKENNSRHPHPSRTTVVSSRVSSPRVFVITFSDKKDSVYLHALAASVSYFNAAPLYVLGLSGQRSPRASKAGRWRVERKNIAGTDPGKLKKLWFLGALLEQQKPLGMLDDDLILFVDAFDVLVQRRLSEELPVSFKHFVRKSRLSQLAAEQHSDETDTVVVLGEHNCWPWPQPELEKSQGRTRPRGVSMGYMRNATFQVMSSDLRRAVPVQADAMCSALRARAQPGTWLYPNSGAYVSTLRGMRALLERFRQLVLQGHFEDQGMMGLALLQHPRGSIQVDSNATIFSSQYGYNADWWTRPACFQDYFAQDGTPPLQKATGIAPYLMHFNGPAGRYRLGWCTAAFLRKCLRPLQYYVDVDAGETHVMLPQYCDPARTSTYSNTSIIDGGHERKTGMQDRVPDWAAARGAIPPKGYDAVPPTNDECITAAQPRIRCINDRCFSFLPAP